MKLSKMLSQHCEIIQLKTFDLELNLSLVSDKSPNLYFVTCSETNTASITNKRLLQNESSSYMFMFSLKKVTFYSKKKLQLFM